MAEEWGYIAIEAPKNIHESIINNASNTINGLVEYVDLDNEKLDLSAMGFDSINSLGAYIVLEYDCSEWVGFSEQLFKTESEIEYIAWHGDEYGTKYFYSLNRGKEAIKISFETEEDEDDIELKIQLGAWVESLPKQLLDKCPDFNCLDEDEYISSVDAKSVDRSKPAPQLNLGCYFRPLVNREELETILDPDFHDFSLQTEDDDEGLFGLFDLFGSKENKEKAPSEYSVFNWFPISEDRNRGVEELLEQVAKIRRQPIYAVNYFGHTSYPYKVFKIDGKGINLIFDTDSFEESDLELLNQFEDPIIGGKVNWMCLNLNHIYEIDLTINLKSHAQEQILYRHKQVKEAQRKDTEEHEAIWAENSEKIEPHLKGVKYYLYYRGFSSTDIQHLGYRLQTYGMRKVNIEKGLGYSGKNTIVVTEESLKLAEWLKNNVKELHEHRIVVEEGSDAIIINMH